MTVWAIHQPRMHWTLDGNLGEVLAALEAAAAAGANGCACTELALTGFHRRLPDLLDATALARAQARVQSACARWRIAAVVGMPSRAPDGAVYNSHVYIDAAGHEVGRVHKRGVTASEAQLFARGERRGWILLAGAIATSVLCREMLDADSLLPELRAALPPETSGPRVIFWPSYIGASDAEQEALGSRYREGAARLARELSAWVLQSNWAESLNAPGAQGFGDGIVIDPSGHIVERLPRDAAVHVMVDLTRSAHVLQISAA